MVGCLAVYAEGKTASRALTKIRLPVDHGRTLAVNPWAGHHVCHALQLGFQELLFIARVKGSLDKLTDLGWQSLNITACGGADQGGNCSTADFFREICTHAIPAVDMITADKLETLTSDSVTEADLTSEQCHTELLLHLHVVELPEQGGKPCYSSD